MTLINCSAVSLKTTTDLINGRVILLVKDTGGKLCLLRPILDDDCGKCVAAKFTNHHMLFSEIGDYDFCMKADGTLLIAYIEKLTGILTIRQESAYNSNDFERIAFRKNISWALFQVKLIKDKNGFVHVFTSNLQPIVDIPNPKDPLLPKQQPCDRDGTIFHSFETPNGDWDMDRHPVSDTCIASFTLELDTRGDSNVIVVAGINSQDGLIYVTQVPGSSLVANRAFTWSQISEPDTRFFYICSTIHKDGTPQLFAIDNIGDVFQFRNQGGAEWANATRIVQQPIMGRQHRDIMAEMDYTGNIKVFVHAEDSFVYTCEQEQPNSDVYIGWMNV